MVRANMDVFYNTVFVISDNKNSLQRHGWLRSQTNIEMCPKMFNVRMLTYKMKSKRYRNCSTGVNFRNRVRR